MIQNFKPYVEVTTLEGAKQVLAMGPAASQIAIKQLGSNGGGFFNVEFGPSVRESDAAVELVRDVRPAGARVRAGLDLRGDGEEQGPRLGGLDHDVHPVLHRA